jgi:hypothetical protein
MPHISIIACDMDRQMQMLNIHAEVKFKSETYWSPKGRIMLQELEEKLQKVVEEYFDSLSSEIYTNHEWNIRMNF